MWTFAEYRQLNEVGEVSNSRPQRAQSEQITFKSLVPVPPNRAYSEVPHDNKQENGCTAA